MARVIDQLGRAVDPLHPRAGLFRVDYRDLAIQHLGGIYEGLLELQPTRALENMIVISRHVNGRLEETYHPESEPVPRGWQLTEHRADRGSVYLQTRKKERRATGSYYTPDHIVSHIVDNTLGPLCDEISGQLHQEIEEIERQIATAPDAERSLLQLQRDELRSSYAERILGLRILDPAMGSGHFLLRACQKLAEEIATHPFTGEMDHGAAAEAESSVSYWKRRVVESCLYGVDLNSLAVELAQLALWLETVASGEPLSFLNHHLRYGNSLIGGRIGQLGVLPGELPLRTNQYGEQVEHKLSAFLSPFQRIHEIPSDTAGRIREKGKVFREFERASEPFRLVGDLWCSAFCSESRLTTDQYQRAIDELGRPRRFAAVAGKEWFQSAIANVAKHFGRCFHWESEFPEAFFDGSGRRERAGFDAVIGNPPYDVVSELETGRDLTAFKAYIADDAEYAPSRRGKNNLYKLFVCRSLELLRDGGYFGFITPMAILGDDQAAHVRRKITEVGSFTGIEAFPQKDNPAKRVFPEAKLSTTVFTVIKTPSVDTASRSFVSRVHPGRWIEAESPQLTLTTEAIRIYDPSNFTIVSCSQNDWDLATRILRCRKLSRLGEHAESFQGEVNETNDRKAKRISYDSDEGPEVIRGAHVCLYAVREASQGTPVFVCVDRFLDRPRNDDDQKAFHHRHRRVGFQRKSPQNNFRRLIAAPIESGTFLLESVSYFPEHKCKLPLEVVLALLNSKLCEWYFRLGSTNAMVGEYQVNNLPCPCFADTKDAHDSHLSEKCESLLRVGRTQAAYDTLRPYILDPPFLMSIRDAIVMAVHEVIAIERERGEITRSERSELDPAAKPFQDFIDRIFYRMAGLNDEEAAGLEERLSRML